MLRRACSCVPSLVLNIAQEAGLLLNIPVLPVVLSPLPSPMCWLAVAVAKVATNSSTRPALKPVVLVGVRRPPSTLTFPPETVEPPAAPSLHSTLVQPAGSVVPENSFPSVGARITSPSVVIDTYVFVSGPGAEVCRRLVHGARRGRAW